MMLNPIIKGWGNYYKYGASGEIFQRMDWEIFKRHGNGHDAGMHERVKVG